MSEPESLSAEVPTPEVLRRALKAFKKRLKLTQLDCESSLGVGPMSGGRPSGIVAISPPDQYPLKSGMRWSNREDSSKPVGVNTS